ncbi:MAG: hypothetical protein FWD73_17140 [Polyangiaceae bacterium]|nr:hypothetical protein [Polyangiaceae bacterium]
MTNDSADMANADGTATDGRRESLHNAHNNHSTPHAAANAAHAARAAAIAAKRKSVAEVIDAFGKPGRELRRIEGRKDFLAYYTDGESAPLPSNAVDELREVPVIDDPVMPADDDESSDANDDGDDSDEAAASSEADESSDSADTVKKKMLVGKLAWLEWLQRPRFRFLRRFPSRAARTVKGWDWSRQNVVPIAASILFPLAFVSGVTYLVIYTQAIDRLGGKSHVSPTTAVQPAAHASPVVPLAAQMAPMALDGTAPREARMQNATNGAAAPASPAPAAPAQLAPPAPAPAAAPAQAGQPATPALTVAGVRTNPSSDRASVASKPTASVSRRMHGTPSASKHNAAMVDNHDVVVPKGIDFIREF